MARRLLRVNEAVRETLSKALAGGLKDPRIGFVTVTGVETSADLRHAKVYVSVLGSTAEKERTLAGLRSSHGFLQERVAAEVRLRRTPRLDFVYDDSVDRGMRIERLLRRHDGDPGTGDPGATEVSPESDRKET
jgi:ribosome-binding factor A